MLVQPTKIFARSLHTQKISLHRSYLIYPIIASYQKGGKSVRLFGKYRMTTFQIIAFGFIALILIGTLLLSLPFASRKAGSVGFLDCLFTATSAVCVTGLVVQDTAACWSPFGQAVILTLIQIGGVGVVTAAVSLAFLSGRKIGLMQRSVMQESISAPQVGGIVRLTRFIVLSSLGMEAVGALLLIPSMIPHFGVGKGIWYAVFHSVSAFCNAGFDLMGAQEPFSSLTGFSQNGLVNVTVMMLITVGGIGFLVWNDVREHGFHWKQYRLQSKAALFTSAWLVILPALWLFFFEMEQIPAEKRILPALFPIRHPAYGGLQYRGFEPYQQIGPGVDDRLHACRRLARLHGGRHENYHAGGAAHHRVCSFSKKRAGDLWRQTDCRRYGPAGNRHPDDVSAAFFRKRPDHQPDRRAAPHELSV